MRYLVVLLMVVGCSNNSAIHCDYIAAKSVCMELPKEADLRKGDGDKDVETFCTASEGSFGQGACPTEGAIGTCAQRGGQLTLLYKTGGNIKPDASKFCTGELAGTWKPR